MANVSGITVLNPNQFSSEGYSARCLTSKTERFAKKVNGF